MKQWEKAAIEGNVESTHIPGWRHRKGDKVWHGREYASELVETEQEATENSIKQMFLRLSSAKMDNRPQKVIMQYQSELNSMVIIIQTTFGMILTKARVHWKRKATRQFVAKAKYVLHAPRQPFMR